MQCCIMINSNRRLLFNRYGNVYGYRRVMLQTRDSPTSALLSGLSFSIRYNVLCTSRGCSCFDAEYTAESDCTVRHQNWCDFATIELDINFHGSKLFS
ncbi:hypothetical protein Tco_1451953, partial [Tanacetum coccineum]